MASASGNIRILIITCLVVFITCRGNAQTVIPYNGPFPVPPINKNSLFYLQRTLDRNTVMYEINYTATGTINRKKPLKIYWIDFEEGGKISALTFAQNKFAYGIEFLELKGIDPIFKINLVSYKKIDMYLKPSGKNKSYEMHVIINGKPSILTSILVHITGGTYLKPIISHIELKGKDLTTGEAAEEKIKTSTK